LCNRHLFDTHSESIGRGAHPGSLADLPRLRAGGL
jgi:hypothetical protein